jgi:Na+-translocating ferredoxin:NAD+ oxidoreductase RnfC subunit
MDTVLEALRDRIAAAAVVDATGRALELRLAPAVIGRVCDDQPLQHTESTLARRTPDRLARGLAAAALGCQAQQAILAVREDDSAACQALARAAEGTRLHLVPLPARCPMDPVSLICDLAAREGRSVSAAGLEGAVVLDAVVLCDLAAALEGQPALRRTVTVAGYLRDAAVVQAALGTRVADLVAACGGCPDPGWVCFENGLLTGRVVERDHAVERTTRGLLVLPHDHLAVRRATTPLPDELGRIAAACAGCRLCSDACTVQLAGGSLEPHRVMQAVGAGWLSRPGAFDELLGALECARCGVCTSCCPSALRPSLAVTAVAGELGRRGVRLAAAHALRPHPDRAGRRQSVARLVERLGLAPYAGELPLRAGAVLPEELRVPLSGPAGGARVAAVRAGERVGRGDVVALAAAGSREPDVRSPVAGVVVAIDPDDGVTIRPR